MVVFRVKFVKCRTALAKLRTNRWVKTSFVLFFARLHPLHLPKQVGGDAGTRFVFGDGQASGVVYFVTWFTKSPDLRLLAVLMKTKAHVHCIHPEHAR